MDGKEVFVVRCPRDELMEPAVLGFDRPDIPAFDCPAQFFLRLFDLLQRLWSDPLGRQASGQLLNSRQGFEEILDILEVHLLDIGCLIWPALNEIFSLEQKQGLSNGCPTNSEFLPQSLLFKDFPGFEVERDDSPLDLLVDIERLVSLFFFLQGIHRVKKE